MFPFRINPEVLLAVCLLTYFAVYGIICVRTGESGMAIVCLVVIGAMTAMSWCVSLLRALREHRRMHREQSACYPLTWVIDADGSLHVTAVTGISIRFPPGAVQRIQLKRKTAIIHGAGGFLLFLPKPMHDQHAARFRTLLRRAKPDA